MRWHDMDGGSWAWMGGMTLVLFAAVIAIVIVVSRRGRDDIRPSNTPDEVLHQRLAAGDIDVDEFQRRLDALHNAHTR